MCPRRDVPITSSQHFLRCSGASSGVNWCDRLRFDFLQRRSSRSVSTFASAFFFWIDESLAAFRANIMLQSSKRIPAGTAEDSDENRMLSIEIDSPTFNRSSQIPVDGKNSQKTTTVEVKNVPTGFFEVRAVLIGASGAIADTMQLVKVEPAAGHTR